MIAKPHEATASWTGYVYQGHVAIYYSLKKINQLFLEQNFDEEIKKYKLEIEWMEDFAIIYDNNYKSIHQVKCYRDSPISEYKETILDLLIKVIKYNDIKSYLHTSSEIRLWNESKIYNIFCRGVENIIDKLESFSKLDNEKQVKKLKANKPKLSIEDMIYDKVGMYETSGEEDAISKSLEDLQKYIDENISIYKDIENFKGIFNKIEHYKYSEDYFINELNIKNEIKNELKIFYKDDAHKINEANCEIVFLNLCGKINEHVYMRKSGVDSKHIDFRDILNILETDLQRADDDYYIYCAQEAIQQLFQEHCNIRGCEEEEEKECTDCNLKDFINRLNSLNLEQFSIFLSNIKPNKIKCDDKTITTLFGGIEDSLFDIIEEIDEFKLNNLKVLSHKKGQTYLALLCSDEDRPRNIRKIVKDIIENDILIKSLYDVNKIVTREIKVKSIRDANPNINIVPIIDKDIDAAEVGRRITEINDISIISKRCAKGEFNDD